MKVCPRCSYVDTEGRRVCLACRRSLMGAPEQELADVIARRESALAGEERSEHRAPWGPAAIDTLIAVPADAEARHSMMASAAVRAPMDPSPGLLERDDVVSASDEVAEETRQQLARMYDTRHAAPAPPDADADARVDALSAPQPARPVTPHERRSRKGRGKVLLALAAAVAVVLGARYVRATLADQDRVTAQDPSTPVDKLPWHRAQYGSVTVQVPTNASTATLDTATGGAFRYERYVLPDLTLTVTTRDAVASLSNEAGLRSYASQVVVQLGGRLLSGFARDATFGTTFSASIELPEGQSYLYLLSTPTEVIEVRAEVRDSSTGRALKIYERVIRSFNPV